MILYIKFHPSEYQKAIDWFSIKIDNSEFIADYQNDEFHSLGFNVESQSAADIAEKCISKELINANFKNFEFELELN